MVAGAAFTLVELLVVIAVIGVLAGLLLPVLGKAREAGRATACLGNLRQIGLGLQLYADENANRLPVMRDAMATNAPPSTNAPPAWTNALPAPDVVLAPHLGEPRIWRCPSDHGGVFEQTRSSYAWNNLLNGQAADRLKVMGLEFDAHQIPVFFDKEAFHRARGAGRGVNYLYADGHIRNLLVLEGSR